MAKANVGAAELEAALPKALAAGTVRPDPLHVGARRTSASPNCSTRLRRTRCRRRASRTKRRTGKDHVTIEPAEAGEFVGQVFKTLSDKFVGNLSFVRVYSGKLTARQPIVNVRTGKTAHWQACLRVQGKATEAMPEAIAGDIVAVAKVEDLHIGDTVATKPRRAEKLPQFTFPQPMFGLAVEPKARGDEQKISGSLHKIADEDPTFNVTRDAQTKELVITGMSQLHLDVIQQRLKKRFDLEIITHEPKIPYRETITAEAAEPIIGTRSSPAAAASSARSTCASIRSP